MKFSQIGHWRILQTLGSGAGTVSSRRLRLIMRHRHEDCLRVLHVTSYLSIRVGELDLEEGLLSFRVLERSDVVHYLNKFRIGCFLYFVLI